MGGLQGLLEPPQGCFCSPRQPPCPLQAAGWLGLERLTSGCRGTVARMLEALEGLPDAERAKYLDVTGQCPHTWLPGASMLTQLTAGPSLCPWEHFEGHRWGRGLLGHLQCLAGMRRMGGVEFAAHL